MRDLLLLALGGLLGLGCYHAGHVMWAIVIRARRRADTAALLQRLLLRSIETIDNAQWSLSYNMAAAAEQRRMLQLISDQLRGLARVAPASGSGATTGQHTTA